MNVRCSLHSLSNIFICLWLSHVLSNCRFCSIPATDHRGGSSGDFSEAPPPPPGFPNTSREAVRGSERTPVISSPAESDFPRASTNGTFFSKLRSFNNFIVAKYKLWI